MITSSPQRRTGICVCVISMRCLCHTMSHYCLWLSSICPGSFWAKLTVATNIVFSFLASVTVCDVASEHSSRMQAQTARSSANTSLLFSSWRFILASCWSTGICCVFKAALILVVCLCRLRPQREEISKPFDDKKKTAWSGMTMGIGT